MSRIALFSPHRLERISGNNTTILRIARGLRAAGHQVAEVEVNRPPTAGAPFQPEVLAGYDLFHAFHAFKTGVAVRAASRCRGVPYVVSITGTDLHEDLEQPARRDEVLAVLREARAILCASREAADILRERHRIRTPCRVVPKGVVVPEVLRSGEAVPEDAPLTFLHVAGWREVKNNLFALEPLAAVAREVPRLRLRFAGPILDTSFQARWLALSARYPFAADAGPVEPDHMGVLYRDAAVFLNTSHLEGGSNAVLEAMAHELPVLASDVPGNRAFIRFDAAHWERSTGVLYHVRPSARAGDPRLEHDAEDFARKARRLALDRELREQIGRNGRQAVKRDHSPEKELEGVMATYRLAGSERPG